MEVAGTFEAAGRIRVAGCILFWMAIRNMLRVKVYVQGWNSCATSGLVVTGHI